MRRNLRHSASLCVLCPWSMNIGESIIRKIAGTALPVQWGAPCARHTSVSILPGPARPREGLPGQHSTAGRYVAAPDPRAASFDDAAILIRELRASHDYVLVALDQPTVVPNATGMRPVERVASSLICRLGSGVQPANRGKKLFAANAPIWQFLR